MIVSSSNGETERDLSWLDFGYLRDLSADGKMILFEEEGSEANNYEVFVRNVDGSLATPLGEGYGIALSPDKKWAMADKLAEPAHQVWLYPVGPGEARRLSPANFAAINVGSFLSDGRRVVYLANEPGHKVRTWLQDIDGGAPRPVTDEGTAGWIVSPDDKWLLGSHGPTAPTLLISLQDGHWGDIPGMKPNDQLLGWSSDGQVYVASTAANNRTALRVDKLNPHTGARTTWRNLVMPPIAGVFPEPPLITPDGATYGFDYRMRLSDLYIVNGVR
jgi:Tol biopolymer transport system component